MKVKIYNNKSKILYFKKKELFLKVYKFVYTFILNFFQTKKKIIPINKLKNFFFQKKIAFFNFYLKNYSKTRIYRRCIVTNRPRAIYRPYNLSRNSLKNFIKFGYLPGFAKTR